MNALEIMRDIAYAAVFQMIAEIDSEDQIVGWLQEFSGPPMNGMEQAACLVYILDIGPDKFIVLAGDLFAEALADHGITMPEEVRVQLGKARDEVVETLELFEAKEFLSEARAELEEQAKDDPELALVMRVNERLQGQIEEAVSQI